jgi:hypothetical protein
MKIIYKEGKFYWSDYSTKESQPFETKKEAVDALKTDSIIWQKGE